MNVARIGKGTAVLGVFGLLLALTVFAGAASARPYGITGGYVKCYDKHHHKVICPPKKHHHHKRHHKKPKTKHHRHTSESKCVIVVNGEKTVTHGNCSKVNVGAPPATTTTTTVVPAEGEHTCEHDPLPGQCSHPQCVMGVEISPGQCTGPVVIVPIEVCEASGTPGQPEFPCGEPPKKESPCAEKICEPLPEEECPEKQEVAGPKG